MNKMPPRLNNVGVSGSHDYEMTKSVYTITRYTRISTRQLREEDASHEARATIIMGRSWITTPLEHGRHLLYMTTDLCVARNTAKTPRCIGDLTPGPALSFEPQAGYPGLPVVWRYQEHLQSKEMRRRDGATAGCRVSSATPKHAVR